MKFAFILIGLFFAGTVQAQAVSCFPAEGRYLVVDHGGLNVPLRLEGRDCKNLKITYGSEPSNEVGLTLKTGGWFDLPPMTGPLPKAKPARYELTWGERNILVKVKIPTETGTICQLEMGFGFDQFNPNDDSFILKFYQQCGTEPATTKESVLYSF